MDTSILSFHAKDPKTGNDLYDTFFESSSNEIDTVVKNADRAFRSFSKIDGAARSYFLSELAKELRLNQSSIVEIAEKETALPKQRLNGELQRTINQINLFVDVIKDGSWSDLRIDIGDANREPLPKPDTRHMLIPIGPVAIFGASNFPLAFSVAGGDTISALASGCTVVFKAHPAHPGTSDLVAKAIYSTIERTGMPQGTFSMIHGVTNEVGGFLVGHPLIKAVGFTGSFAGGKALFDHANKREEPIPVYAEMGSVNPVFVLPEILKEKGSSIAKGLTNSITLGIGQFCTNPGLSFVLGSKEADQFIDHLADGINNTVCSSMLTENIRASYEEKTSRLSKIQGIELYGEGKADDTTNSVSSRLYRTTGDTLLGNPILSEEVFGPSSILAEASSKEELLNIANGLTGHLTATVFGTQEDFKTYKELMDILETKVGRVIINDYPTGVEVGYSMVHGGPYPATTAAQSTSVGANAIKRFVRPICYQDYPQELLPEPLRNENKLNVWRLINGKLTKESI